MDAVCLDIECTEDVERMVVTIVDPHLQRSNDYLVSKRASELGVLVQPKSGKGDQLQLMGSLFPPCFLGLWDLALQDEDYR